MSSSSAEFFSATFAEEEEDIPIEIEYCPSKQPRWKTWLDSVWNAIDIESYKNTDTFKRNISQSPFEKRPRHFLHKTLNLIATEDPSVVARLLGLHCLQSTKYLETIVTHYCAFILYRGNVQGRNIDRMKTNCEYMRRIMDFLGFLSEHPEMQTSYQDICLKIGKSVDEAQEFINPFDGKALLVTETSAIAFFKQKATERNQKVSKNSPVEMLNQRFQDKEVQNIDLDAICSASDEDDDAQRRIKRPKQEKCYIRKSDWESYENAIRELESFQIKFLQAEGLLPTLKQSIMFRKYGETEKRKIKSREMTDCYDKGANSLSTTPGPQEIEAIIAEWMEAGTSGNTLRCYVGLTNIAILTCMLRGGMSRADSMFRVHYSDLEFKRLTELATTVKRRCNPHLYMVRSNESKVNKDGHFTYFARLPHMEVLQCSLVREALMLSMRHDICHVPINSFENITSNAAELKRPWYEDLLYNQLRIPKESASDGDEGGTDKVLKEPYKLEAMSASWRSTMAKLSISCYHTLHVGRQVRALTNSFNGMSEGELSRLGGWSESMQQSLLISYAVLPSIDTLCMAAGASCLEDYYPIWYLIDPPSQLCNLVLEKYHFAARKARERNDRARNTKDPLIRIACWDDQSISTSTYMTQLARLLTCAAPFIRQRYPSHRFVLQHKIFRHELFEDWSLLIKTFVTMMEGLQDRVGLVFNKLRDVNFSVSLGIQNLKVTCKHPSSLGEDMKKMIDTFCEGIQASFESSRNPEIPLETRDVEKDQQHPVTPNDTEPFTSKVAYGMSYHDIKGDLASIKDSLQTLTMLKTTEISSKLELDASRRLDNQLEEKDYKKTAKTPPEIESLPLLSTLDRSPNPLLEVYKIWTQGIDGSRPLRDIDESPKKGYKRYPEALRSVSETAKKIRHIAWMIDLLFMEGVNDPCQALLPSYRRMKTLNETAKTIQKELKEAKLSTPGQKQSAQSIYNNEYYKSARLFWKNI